MAAIKRASTGKFTIGTKVRCTHAATSAYRTGEDYDVVEHPETGGPCIKARDGLLDFPSLVVSMFEPISATKAPPAIGVAPK